MKGALWSIVAAFAIVLLVAADIPIQPNIDIPKLTGKWHALGVVFDYGEVKGTLSYHTQVVVEKNGDVLITREFPKKKNCKNLSVHFKPTDQPGKLATASQSSILRVVETDYYSYSLFHIESHLISELYLHTRKRKVSDVAKEKFKTVATSLGFAKDKIVYRTKSGSCPN